MIEAIAEALHERYAAVLCLDPDPHEWAACRTQGQWRDDATIVMVALTTDETGRHRFRLSVVVDREAEREDERAIAALERRKG